jgi:iron only hydrogenase large subunit-like protein
LAVNYNLTLDECTKKLAGLFRKNFDAHYVFDTTFARDFSLHQSQLEFVERFKANKNKLPILSSACPGRKMLFFFLLI